MPLPVTSADGSLVRLLAGSSADERRPATSPGPEREWHLPAHARDAQAVRERMTAQVIAGADVLLAHTFLTHRRALARVGEARRARELTLSAVVLAREAAERGRDRRDEEATWSTVPVLVAGSLPLLGDDPGSGRLGSVDASIARDLHDHAGLLADAGSDIVLVEGPRSPAETAVAVSAGRSVGIETWTVVGHDALLSQGDEFGGPEVFLRALRDASAGPDGPADAAGAFDRRHGTMIDPLFHGPDPASALRSVLASGATVLAIADGATPERLTIARSAIEAHRLERSAAEESSAAEWLDWVGQGAARAPAGAALWLSASTPRDLPAGWDWTVLAPERMRQIPGDRYRLIVSQMTGVDAAHIGHGLEPGGVVVLAAVLDGLQLPESLRTIERHDTDDRATAWFICRREER